MRWVSVVAVVALSMLGACSGSDDAPAETPKAFDVSGTASLLVSEDIATGNGGTCRGVGEHGDMKPGAAVAIYDGAGNRIGLGSLETGSGGTGGYCDFPFTVTGVPKSDGVYAAEVSDRGQVAFQEADADNVKLTID